MTTYMSAGFVVGGNYKRATKFLPLTGGKLVESEGSELILTSNKNTDIPVGWLVDIEKTSDNKFRLTNTRDSDEDTIPDQIVKRYSVESLANRKEIELWNMKQRGLKIRTTIEGMTMKELKEWSDKSPINKKAVLYYLLEVF